MSNSLLSCREALRACCPPIGHPPFALPRRRPGGAGSGVVLRITIGPVFKGVTLTNGTLTLTWSTDAGWTYQLQYKSDLNSGNWINLGNSVLATGSTLSASDLVANDPQRFYRVAVLPQ